MNLFITNLTQELIDVTSQALGENRFNSMDEVELENFFGIIMHDLKIINAQRPSNADISNHSVAIIKDPKTIEVLKNAMNRTVANLRKMIDGFKIELKTTDEIADAIFKNQKVYKNMLRQLALHAGFNLLEAKWLISEMSSIHSAFAQEILDNSNETLDIMLKGFAHHLKEQSQHGIVASHLGFLTTSNDTDLNKRIIDIVDKGIKAEITPSIYHLAAYILPVSVCVMKALHEHNKSKQEKSIEEEQEDYSHPTKLALPLFDFEKGVALNDEESELYQKLGTTQTCWSRAKCKGTPLSHRDKHNCKVKSNGKSWSDYKGKCYNRI